MQSSKCSFDSVSSRRVCLWIVTALLALLLASACYGAPAADYYTKSGLNDANDYTDMPWPRSNSDLINGRLPYLVSGAYLSGYAFPAQFTDGTIGYSGNPLILNDGTADAIGTTVRWFFAGPADITEVRVFSEWGDARRFHKFKVYAINLDGTETQIGGTYANNTAMVSTNETRVTRVYDTTGILYRRAIGVKFEFYINTGGLGSVMREVDVLGNLHTNLLGSDGQFGAQGSWQTWTQSGTIAHVWNWNDTTNKPSGSGGGAAATNDTTSGWYNGGIYRSLGTLASGTNNYTISGLYREWASSSEWAEVHIGTNMPSTADYSGNILGPAYKSDSSTCGQWNGAFNMPTSSGAGGGSCVTRDSDGLFSGTGATTYLTIKVGCSSSVPKASFDDIAVTANTTHPTASSVSTGSSCTTGTAYSKHTYTLADPDSTTGLTITPQFRLADQFSSTLSSGASPATWELRGTSFGSGPATSGGNLTFTGGSGAFDSAQADGARMNFRPMYKVGVGSFSIRAKVTINNSTSANWGMAGIYCRQYGTSNSDDYIFVGTEKVSSSTTYSWPRIKAVADTGGFLKGSGARSGTGFAAGTWYRIDFDATTNKFSAYYSTDGTNWSDGNWPYGTSGGTEPYNTNGAADSLMTGSRSDPYNATFTGMNNSTAFEIGIASQFAVVATIDFFENAGWTTATSSTNCGGEGTTGLSASSGGVSHTFVWNATSDVGGAGGATQVVPDAYLQVVPSDGRVGVQAASSTFAMPMTCTPPATPGVPTVGSPTASSLNITNNAGDSSTAYFAFRINGGGYSNQYVQANGTVGASAVWQLKATWGTKTVTGLSPNTTYTFDVQAANDASGTCPSGFSTAATGTTSACTGTELLANGDFELRASQSDYSYWTEGGDALNCNPYDWTNTACSGGHGSYSPGIRTWEFCDTNVHESTLSQTVNMSASACYKAMICWAAEHWCSSTLNHTVPKAKIDVMFYNAANGGGTLLRTDSTGYVNHSATAQAEDTLTVQALPPTGTMSAVMKIYLNTGAGGSGCGYCGGTGHYTVTAHKASFQAACPTVTTPLAPTVSGATQSTLNVANNASDSATDYFAISIGGGAYTLGTHYVQADGSVSTTAVWQQKATWGTKTVTGLASGTTYTFALKAATNALGACATALGSGTTGTTTTCAVPTITTHPASTTVSCGSTASFSVVASGQAPLSYQWQKNSSNIGGATTSSYTTPATTWADNGAQYRCIVTNACPGTATSNQATLTVTDTTAPTVSAVTPSPTCVNSGGTVTVTATVTDNCTALTTANIGMVLPGAANLLTNPSFESDLSSGWTNTSSPSYSRISSGGYPAPGAAKDGTYWAATSCAWGSGVKTPELRQAVTVTAGSIYYLSVWVHTDGSPNTCSAYLQYKNGAASGDGEGTTVASRTSNTTGWMQLSGFVRPTTTTMTYILKLSWDCGSSGGGGNWDMAEVRLATNPATYASNTATWTGVTITAPYKPSVCCIDGAGNVGSATSASTVNLNPVAPTSASASPATICAGASSTLTASGGSGDSCKWYTGSCGGTLVGTGTSITVNPTSTTTYYVRWETAACGNSSCAQTTVTVNTAPSISVHPQSQTKCVGQSVTFSVTASGTPSPGYQWRKGGSTIGGATTSSYSIGSVATGDAANYDCVVSNSCGTVTSNPATLTVNTAPEITGHPISQTICSGQTATFTVTASGTPTPTYQWRSGGSPIGGATNASYSTGAAGSYDCVATNACGSATSNPATLTVDTAPSITVHPESQTVMVGESVTFTVTASGATGYQWRKDQDEITDATSSSYTIELVAAEDAGDYDCVVSNMCGSATSTAATLTVNAAPEITTHPISQTICSGQTATFTVSVSGAAPMSYQWRESGDDINGATDSSYETGTAGSYDCVVSNAYGSATSTAATLTVNTAPSISAHPSNQTVCPGSTGIFSVTASGTPTPGYQWRLGGNAIEGATDSSYEASLPGSYDCVVSNYCGTSTSNAATLTVADTEAPSISSVPSDMTVHADPDGTTAVVTWASPTATDNCDGTVAVTCDPASGSVFPAGDTMVTCSATDSSSNTGQRSFKVTVLPYNKAEITVELQGVTDSTIGRCLDFQFSDGVDQYSARQMVTLTNKTGAATLTEIPAGKLWECVSVKDKLHTLRSRVDLGKSGHKYVASLTSGDKLLSGDLTNDNLIDILDFGAFVGKYAQTLPASDCDTPLKHADISGNGSVGSEDFSSIQINWLKRGEGLCEVTMMASLATVEEVRPPRASMTVAEMKAAGIADADKADLNRDGVVDLNDIKLFLQKTRKK